MANQEHLEILKHGVQIWNQWRQGNPGIRADLRRARLVMANLRGANLSRANLHGANLSRANLREADFFRANLTGTDLGGAKFHRANLNRANFSRANLDNAKLGNAILAGANLSRASLRAANLTGADLSGSNLYGANLGGANLNHSILVRVNLQEANLTDCHVYGVSVWDPSLEGSSQLNLVITPGDQPAITVDNLEVAQFIYLLLNNEKIRAVIDTITSKLVLILGRFTPARKKVLDTIREELREHNYLPVLFDFSKPANRDLTETVRTLAHLSRFIIADITEPRSIPQELQSIVPDLAVPIQPLLLKGAAGEYGMFESFRKYHWVLSIFEYSGLDELLSSLGEKVIEPAEAKVIELRGE